MAAGASSRMGRPKLLLPWKGDSILGHVWGLLRQLRPVQSILVLAPDHPFGNELDRLEVASSSRVVNPESRLGMFSSVKAGFAWPGWNSEVSHFLLALGDQPLVSPSDLEALLGASRENPAAILQPLHRGKRGHPVIFPREIGLALPAMNYFSLKEALADFEAMLRFVESCSPGTLQDIDTPDDYQNLSPGNSADTNA